MIRLLVRMGIVLVGSAVGLIVAALVLDGFEVDLTSFIVAVIIFTVTVALMTPFLDGVLRRNRSSSAALGGVALIATFVALLLANALSDGVRISGVGTWLAAPLIVWVVSMLAVLILPFLGLKKYLDERRD